ncbi:MULTISPECIES: hypothetical protein [unclassified Microbacterium]|uniref:hypothetical protein n=1 Tax=unclassified Microbacterium TaxID=2609290 RepID=UPI00214B165F|nr:MULTISPECIES: hypothetical protein [unclassified Microbacterium]MCR2783481.1 hypothetical protein [Microbacterium sp. zg.B96]MDL5351732.1 hypothetical protein [Microbacterium sp. zg-YB36]WIM15656.1 hypothetical protein QNO11_14130 [Microbacterium sp. zg-B96]
MTPAVSRREQKAARRDEISGAGPVPQERPPAQYPGATGRFALFGEVMLTGLLVTVVSVLVITLPVALAAGIRHLRRFTAAEDSRQELFWRDVRRGLLPGAVVGLVALVAALVLLLDIDLARSGFLPGGAVIEVIGWVGLAVVALTLLTAAAAWTPQTGWLAAIRTVPRRVTGDIAGAAYLVATAGFVVVVTWVLVPLFIPAIGCAALAVVAVPTRRRGRA